METTCQYVELHAAKDLGIPSNATVVCGAPIPRLDEGPCTTCDDGHWWEPDEHVQFFHALARSLRLSTPHTYLGPLASECSRGHPVAVPSEAERRG
jgi:hypothetical protein